VQYQDIFPDRERNLSGPIAYRMWTTGLLKSSVDKCSTNTHINLITTEFWKIKGLEKQTR